MKRLLLICFIFMYSCDAETKMDKKTSQELIQEVKAEIAEFGNLYTAADTSKLKSFLSSTYLHTNPDGKKISKEEWLKWVGSRRTEIQNGNLIIDVYEIRDLHVRLLSDKAAVAEGIVYSTGKENSEPFTIHIKFTNVWIKEEGKWKRTVFHDSRIEN